MGLSLSKRQEWVLQSEIRQMSIESDRIGGINLSQGVCDLEVPLEVRQGAREAIENRHNSYTRYDGLEELRQAIAYKQKLFHNVDIDPEKEIIVSGGSTGALYCACLALLNPGDEVIVFEPYYGYHISTLWASEAVPVYVKMTPPDWRFEMADLEKAVTTRSRAILVNTPANPSGKVFSRREIEAIADFATHYDLFVFTDEIYEHFIYDGQQHIPPATLPVMKERTITVSGLSKTFSITGWRIGYSISDPRWTQAIGYFSDLVYVCAPSPLQAGVAKGLMDLDRDYYLKLSQEYLRKRDLLAGALDSAGLTPYIPQGAYYIMADLSKVPGDTSKGKAMYLLERIRVACVPGEAFYHDGGGEMLGRFCYAKDDSVLQEACERIRKLKL